mgnify:CR=1 FL=1
MLEKSKESAAEAGRAYKKASKDLDDLTKILKRARKMWLSNLSLFKIYWFYKGLAKLLMDVNGC